MQNIERIDRDKAPRPGRRSFVRSVYDAVYASHGEATLQEIIELIPTTDDAGKWDAATPKRVMEVIQSGITQGYLCDAGGGRWSIAPKSYWKQCQEAKTKSRVESAARRLKGDTSRMPNLDRPKLPSASDSIYISRRSLYVGLALFVGIGIGYLLGAL